MKYVLLFCGTGEDAAAFETLSSEELRVRYPQVGAWFAERRSGIGGSNQLQGPDTATLVRRRRTGTRRADRQPRRANNV
jgi:hypothetical protein